MVGSASSGRRGWRGARPLRAGSYQAKHLSRMATSCCKKSYQKYTKTFCTAKKKDKNEQSQRAASLPLFMVGLHSSGRSEMPEWLAGQQYMEKMEGKCGP